MPAGRDELAGLLGYLRRLVALDGRAAVRLQASGEVLGVWGFPPLDVVALRPVRLAAAVDLDVTVSAQRLVDAGAGPAVALPAIELPVPVPGPPAAGLLPPRSGWETLAVVPAAAVHDAVRVAVEGFARRVDQLPVEQRVPATLEQIATHLWDAPVVAGVPLRAAHAADRLGLLGREGEVSAYSTGPWLRLGCPGGSVALRTGSGRTDLDLGIWSLSAVPGRS
jgi:hypothetical protein